MTLAVTVEVSSQIPVALKSLDCMRDDEEFIGSVIRNMDWLYSVLETLDPAAVFGS